MDFYGSDFLGKRWQSWWRSDINALTYCFQFVLFIIMEQRTKYKTNNTFTRTPCANQIISYLVILAENISFWLLIQANYSSSIFRVAMIVLFAVSTVLLIIFTLMASVSDPSDPIMIDYKNGKSAAYKVRWHSLAQTGKSCLFCEHCESYVIATSRHCKICDRYFPPHLDAYKDSIITASGLTTALGRPITAPSLPWYSLSWPICFPTLQALLFFGCRAIGNYFWWAWY